MKVIHTEDILFEKEFNRIKDRGKAIDETVTDAVREIVDDVAKNGDAALFKYTKRFEQISLNADTVEVTPAEIENAIKCLDASELEILEFAARRIEKFHRKQLTSSWWADEEEGITLGQLVTPLNRVGVYAPGGLAPYPSTVLMATIPAKIAGVREIFMVTPSKGGKINPLVLAAANLSGVDRIFKIGGAQAVAALAYGTESIPPVDKIVGPGNVYVTTAKGMVYGKVGIDMMAGPSEVLIISDGTADPSVVAADLLSQAEHDEMASAILLTPAEEFAFKVAREVEVQLKSLSRESIATRAIENFSAVIVTKDMDEAIEITNRFAPEHLQLMVEEPDQLLEKIENAGAVFLGYSTPEVLGDYIAGPNHILPTGGTARFSSPLGVYDFVKRTSVISFSRKSLQKYGDRAVKFASMEGLDAHGKSITVRLAPKNP
ncbi:MAG: histidinol dehydrogenase [Syntrophales bacterium]|nr:histidinol dehydrogenase [Syntrophales bacterium]